MYEFYYEKAISFTVYDSVYLGTQASLIIIDVSLILRRRRRRPTCGYKIYPFRWSNNRISC